MTRLASYFELSVACDYQANKSEIIKFAQERWTDQGFAKANFVLWIKYAGWKTKTGILEGNVQQV